MAMLRSASCPPAARSPSGTCRPCAFGLGCRCGARCASCRLCRTSTSRSFPATRATTNMSWLDLDRRKAGLVAARDLRDAVSELSLILAMVGLTIAIPVASAIGVRGLALYGGGTAVVNRLSVVGAFFVVFIPASFSLVLALESFVGERERTTLEVLIALGLSTICQVAAMVAGAVIISLNARTMRAANVMASFIILPMSVALQTEAALILLGRTEFLWGFAGLMLALAAILLRMGLNGFSREALLARDAGLRRPLQRAANALRASFQRRPGILRLLWWRRTALLVAAFGLPAGAVAGYIAGVTGAIPAPVVKPALSTLIAAAGDGTQLDQALSIVSHNLLAILLVAPLALITAGLSGFLLTFLPGFLLGFAASQSSWSIALTGIFPNGLVEIPVAIIAGGLAIHIGAAVIHMEASGGWTARVLAAGADYVRALRWLVPGLIVAAVLEVRFG